MGSVRVVARQAGQGNYVDLRTHPSAIAKAAVSIATAEQAFRSRRRSDREAPSTPLSRNADARDRGAAFVFKRTAAMTVETERSVLRRFALPIFVMNLQRVGRRRRPT